MKTIGQTLKSFRVEKKYSLKRLEEVTKIKREFLESLEGEKWERLPPFPTVLGFAKSVAAALGANERVVTATLRRDYPPKKLNINPKPDIGDKFSWSPRLTFAVGMGLAILAIFGYLIFQYTRFVLPPTLKVESPRDGQEVFGRSVAVFGSTDEDVKIEVNNEPVLVDKNGKFATDIKVVPETREIVIKAISRSGKESTISRRIEVH